MAANLVRIMAQPLYSLFPNPNLSSTFKDSLYSGLSWGGLENTTSYYNRPDSLFIKAVNQFSRDTTLHAPFIFNNTPLDTIKFDAHNLNMIYGCH